MSIKSKQNSTALAIVAIIALLGIIGYQWFTNSQLKSDLTNQETQLFELEKVNTELDQDYQAALESLEELRDDSKELNELIDNQKRELKAQKDKVNNLLWSKRELGKAKDEISKFQDMTAGYIVQINTLKSENERLYAENVQLEGKNQVLSTEVSKEKQLNSQLSEAKAALAKSNEKLDNSNQKLSTQVDMANAIKINFMEVQGYEVKDNGDIKKKRKAKNIEMIRTCFKTESNYVTPAGEKEFFVRIISPTGETLATDNSGSGVLTDKLTEKKVRYTSKGTLEYNNEDAEGCIDWTTNFKLSKGTYDIELYNNGFMVGKGQHKMK